MVSNERTEQKDDKEELKQFHRLTDVSLRTMTTVLALLFAYVLASRDIPETLRIWITAVWVTILIGDILAGIGLLCGEKEIRVARGMAYVSLIIMFFVIALMIVLLSWVMYSI